MTWIKSILISLLSLLGTFCYASDVEMATGMRSNGKIYVVVAVLVLMIVGYLLYLVATDRRLKKLEEEVSEKLKD